MKYTRFCGFLFFFAFFTISCESSSIFEPADSNPALEQQGSNTENQNDDVLASSGSDNSIAIHFDRGVITQIDNNKSGFNPKNGYSLDDTLDTVINP